MDVQSTFSMPSLQYELHERVIIDLLNPLPSPLTIEEPIYQDHPYRSSIYPCSSCTEAKTIYFCMKDSFFLANGQGFSRSRPVFSENLNFSKAKAEMTFLKTGFSRVTSLYFPMAKYDRIHFACRLLSVLFLIDGNTHIPFLESSSPSKSGEKRKKGRQAYRST